MTDQWQIYPY